MTCTPHTSPSAKDDTVRENQPLAATSPDADPGYPRSGQGWATWLRHAHHAQPTCLPPSPSDTEAAWIALTHLAHREGFTVEHANCADADGFTTWRNHKIQISPDIAPGQDVVALAHQLGHVLLHGQTARLESSATVPCTGLRKVEADSVAYLAATSIGIDTTAITFPHVTSWAGTDPRARPAAAVQAVTSRILTATAAITARFDAVGLVYQQLPAPSRGATRREVSQRVEPLISRSDHARIHQVAAQFFRSHMPGSWVPGYLARRGLTAAVQDIWHAGYAPAQWDALTRHLQAAGYTDTVIEATGLARRSQRGTLIDTFRDRAMLPIRTSDGTIVAFIGRAREHADPGTPKYLNSPATSHYSKSEILFGLWEARVAFTSGARPVIVEGPLDAIAVTTAGDSKYAGVAPCGTALTAGHIAALAQAVNLLATGIAVAFDPDNAGRRAAVRAYKMLTPLTEKLAAIALPVGQDPAHIVAARGPAALADILGSRARPLPDLVVNAECRRWGRRLRDAEGQIGALRASAPLIAAMPPAHVARQVARLAAILQLDHALVTEAVTDAVTTLVDSAASSRDATIAQRTISHRASRAGTHDGGSDSPDGAQQAIQQATGIEPTSTCGSQAGTGQPRLTSRRARS
jgi:DNA primase